jgi:hypothetical protein
VTDGDQSFDGESSKVRDDSDTEDPEQGTVLQTWTFHENRLTSGPISKSSLRQSISDRQASGSHEIKLRKRMQVSSTQSISMRIMSGAGIGRTMALDGLL